MTRVDVRKAVYRKRRSVALYVMSFLMALPSVLIAVELDELAPDFTLRSNTAFNLRLADFRGQVVMINFWATWCGPCLQEMPILDRMHEKYESAGFTLFGVNVDKDPLKAERFIQQLGVSFPILYDDESIAGDLYDVDSMPFSVFVDRAGYLRYVHKEFKPGDEKGYEPIIQALVLN